jgi:hypothetical protein
VFGSAVPSRAFAISRSEIDADNQQRGRTGTAKRAGQSGVDAVGGAIQQPEQAATPQTGAVTTGSSLSPEQLAATYAAAGFTGENLVIMVAVAMGESGGNAQAQNLNASEDSRGLSQINTFAHPQYDKDRLYDPAYNAQAAFEVSGGGQNFGPWTVYSKGLYQQYMDEARAAVAAAGGGGAADPMSAATGAPEPPENDLSGVLDTPGSQFGIGGPVKLKDAGGM